MAKRGFSRSSMKGLRSMTEALIAIKGGRVDVGFFAGDAARSAKGGAGSRPGFFKPGTSAAAVAAIKAGRRPPEEAQTNPQIAAKHEFGIGVPRRSMLRMPLHLHGDKVLKDAQAEIKVTLKEVGKNPRRTAKRLLDRVGIGAENLVQEAFDTSGFGSWPANSPTTILLQGSDRPLIDTAQMRRAVASRAQI